MESRAFSADGIDVSFEVAGAGDPTLVFVHGWSCDRRYWRHQMEHFARRNRVVAIDLAGHGASGAGRQEWTMPAFGEDVAAVARHMDLRSVVLVGHSMGGDVIVEAARRLAGIVAGLVWVDTYRTLEAGRTHEEVERILEPLRADREAATRELVGGMFLPTADEELKRWVIEDMASAPADVALGALEHAITFMPDVVAALPEIDAPIVAINPDHKPTDVEGLRRHDVDVVFMSEVGHFLMMEDPPTFNRLLEEILERFARGAGSVPR